MNRDQIKLLLIEDNEPDARLISGYLKESPVSSFEIRRARSLSEALAAIQEEKFEGVLTDLNLPDSAGLVTLNAIVKAGGDLSVLVLTGFDDEQLGIEALHQGAQDYLVKGKIDSSSLIKSVRYAIERKSLEILLKQKSAEQQKSQRLLVSVNKTLKALGHSAQAMMRAATEQEYLNEVCRIVVEDCGYLMAWIGFAQNNENKDVRPAVQYGFEKGYLKTANITWADTDRGHGPTGTAIRTGETSVCRNMLVDPKFGPWRQEAIKRGYASSIALPLFSNEKPIGALTIYSRDPDPFSPEEIELLKELSEDLSYGITSLRLTVAYQETMEDLRQSREELEKKVKSRTTQLVQTNEELLKEITERQKIEQELRAKNVLFKLATQSDSRGEYIKSAVKLLRGWSGCKYVGIRLVNEQGVVPYESYLGFSREFYRSENAISLEKDRCACIRVITGRPSPSDLNTMTEFGSFYCGDTEKYMSGLPAIQRAKFRGACFKEGFSTLTIIPLSYKGKIIGAIHLADKNKNKLTQERVDFLEALAPQIGEDYSKLTLADQVSAGQELLERIFSSTNLMIAYLDSKLRFIRVNKAYAQTERKTPEFFAGKKHFDLYPDKENEVIFKQVLETGKPYSAYAKPFVYLQHPERGVTYWDWSLQPVNDAKGEVEGLVFVIVDVTKRRRAEEELEKTRLKLLDAKRLTDIGTLAATVAHELRNPLAAIQMASYNIRRKAQNPILDKHLSTIDNKVDESEQIISNLLFYSRIRPPRYENVNVCDIINECAEFTRKRFAKEGISLKVDCDPVKKLFVDVDPLQIKEVFGNILNNAYESKPYGGKSVITVKAEGDNDHVKIAIKDNGEGINQHDLGRIFDPFFTTKARGTGLGLTVCKQIVEFHGGAIDIKSKKGSGTSVIVKLPIKRETNA